MALAMYLHYVKFLAMRLACGMVMPVAFRSMAQPPGSIICCKCQGLSLQLVSHHLGYQHFLAWCAQLTHLHFGGRLKWASGQPYDGMYDAAPTTVNATQFVRVHDGDLVIDCKRCALEVGLSGIWKPSWCAAQAAS